MSTTKKRRRASGVLTTFLFSMPIYLDGTKINPPPALFPPFLHLPSTSSAENSVCHVEIHKKGTSAQTITKEAHLHNTHTHTEDTEKNEYKKTHDL